MTVKLAMIAALIIFYIVLPVFAIWLTEIHPIFQRISAVVLCYIFGMLAGNTGIMPESVEKLQENFMTVTVLLSIPLLLFSIDIKKWSRLAGKTFLSFLMILLSVFVVTMLAHLMFSAYLGQESWKVAGMMIGVYSGGAPNMAAIATALDVESETFLMANTADIAIGGIFYVPFMYTFAKPFFSKFLPPFKPLDQFDSDDSDYDVTSYKGFADKKTLLPLAGALGLSVVILVLGASLSFVIPKEYAAAVVILTVTTLGIVFSFMPRVRGIEKSFQLGQYFLLIFCVVIGSMAEFHELIKTAPPMVAYVGLIVVGSMVIHALGAYLFKIDTDTYIITSVAAICAPPFVGPCASVLNNKEVVVSGVTTGIIGYAAGNYLGISTAYLVKYLSGI